MVQTRIERILVAVKPRERHLPLSAAQALALSQGLHAEMVVMSVVYEPRVALAALRGREQAEAAREALLEDERGRLEALARPLGQAGVAVSVRARWHTSVHEAILDEVEAWPADLLVVGAHRPRLVPHTVLVDTDWQLMRLCPCPLLVVKDPALERYGSILATVDPLHGHGEPEGLDRAVLENARALANAFGSELRVAHAFPDPDSFVYARAVEAEPGEWYGAENIEGLHRRALIDVVSYYGVKEAEIDLRPGEAVDVISAVVEERRISLVVLGAVKRGRLEALLGSTAEAVAAEVPCDVLLVKARAQAHQRGA